MKKLILAAMAAAMLCAPASVFAANESVDMAKLTCKELLNSGDKMNMFIMWIDGYMSGKSDDTTISDEWMEKLGKHLGQYCAANPQKTIMDAMDAMPE